MPFDAMPDAIRYLSVCSGIEAASVAWQPLGWHAAAFSEIEAFPRAVLKHHYASIPCHGDFTTIQDGDYGPIDLLVGGTPCQDFSVAGLRAGLAGERGKLTIEFVHLAGRLRPRWLVWENVPGVLSADEGRAFATFLGLLGQCGYGFAYRVLDAQYFGVPQRRRRVFVVGYLGDWRPAAAVLFEPESLRGDSPPSRETEQRIAASLTRGADSSSKGGYAGRRREDDKNLTIVPILEVGKGSSSRGEGPNGCGIDRADDPMFTLQAGAQHAVAAFGGNNTSGPVEVAAALAAHGGPHGRQDFASETFIAHSLRAEGFDASEDGTGRGVPLVAASLDASYGRLQGASHQDANHGHSLLTLAIGGCGDSHDLEWRDDETANAILTPNGGRAGIGVGAVGYMPARTFGEDGGIDCRYAERKVCDALHTSSGGGNKVPLIQTMAVRRLTPEECEALQGFPRGYTKIAPNTADGPRYRALGNSMAVPVMRWLGERIAFVSALMRDQ